MMLKLPIFLLFVALPLAQAGLFTQKHTARKSLSKSVSNAAASMQHATSNLQASVDAATSSVKDTVNPPPPSKIRQMQERLGLKQHEPTVSERVSEELSKFQSTASENIQYVSQAAASAMEPEPESTWDKLKHSVGLGKKPQTITERAKSNMAEQGGQLHESAKHLQSDISKASASAAQSVADATAKAQSAAKSAMQPEQPSTLDRILQGVGLKSKPSTLSERAASTVAKQRVQLAENTEQLRSRLGEAGVAAQASLQQAGSVMQSRAAEGLSAGQSMAKSAMETDKPSRTDRVLQGMGLKSKPSTLTERVQAEMEATGQQLKDGLGTLSQRVTDSDAAASAANSIQGAASQVRDGISTMNDKTADSVRSGVSSIKTKLASMHDSTEETLEQGQDVINQRYEDLKQALEFKTSTRDDTLKDASRFAEHAYKRMQQEGKNLNKRIHDQVHSGGVRQAKTTSFDDVQRRLQARMAESQTQAEKQLHDLQAKSKDLQQKAKLQGKETSADIEKQRQELIKKFHEYSESTGSYALNMKKSADDMLSEAKSKTIKVGQDAEQRFKNMMATANDYYERLEDAIVG
eukprot:TRINITY_DN8140_c0_g2_i2.p1 TRINITY_DN8140_c0_g2~~TRINITY_DN8140_c0_g2_i2.p1  ORF type:complete len:579 (+),score=199.23 TRINITY_DN8140_c0_g2_i2:1560-3296(+)